MPKAKLSHWCLVPDYVITEQDKLIVYGKDKDVEDLSKQ